jgi:cell division protein FtsW
MQLERKLLIFSTAALAGLGLLMVYSSSITARPSFSDQKYLTRQLMFMAAGVVAAAVAARVPVDLWRKAAVPFFALVTALLVAVLIPGVGSRINGAQRWFRFASISVQPSELAKVSIVLFLAWALERKGDEIRRFWKGWLPLMVPPLVVSGLVLIEPDFGTALFLMAIAMLMLFLAGVPLWHMLAGVAAAVPAVGFLVLAQPYRVKRVFQFLEGWSDPNAAPYQVQQSLVALGSGGLWGTGLGQGWQKLGFLPEANTDFVFAVVGEELGLAGTLTVLALWGTFLVCGVRLAREASSDRFAFLAALGLIGQSVFQAALNVAVVTGSLPPKGISLPFISAGGSNLIISLVSVGIVLGLTRAENRGLRKEDRGSKRVHAILNPQSSILNPQS